MSGAITIVRDAPPFPATPRHAKYPFAELQVHDAIDIELGADEDMALLTRRVSTAARQWCRRHNPEARFAIRQSDDRRSLRCRREA